jgi:hypothetical protein
LHTIESAKRSKDKTVTDQRTELRYELALANRILANENVFDAFGHVSLRHPEDPDRYLLARSRAPQLVEPGDILDRFQAGLAAVGAALFRGCHSRRSKPAPR